METQRLKSRHTYSYNKFFSPYSFKYGHIERIVDWILKESDATPPLRMLDVGVDDKAYYPALQKLGTLVTLDPFPESGADVIADICDCDIRENSFDAAFLFYILEHLKDPVSALISCKRIVRPGGYVAGIVPQYWHTHGYPSDYWRFTQFGITHLLENCGLKPQLVWPLGGPFLIAFHAIEIALRLRRANNPLKVLAYNTLGKLMNTLDYKLTGHGEKEGQSDCVAWSFIAYNKK
jgi:SAM-dependent methyltransferase